MKIFCSGIGGIGLSAYASLMKANGHEVSGTDRSLSIVTKDLAAQGIAVSDRQDGSQVPHDADLLVYSEAIPEDAPERRLAMEHSIRQLSYFAALGELSKDYTVIAVCGAHGKSSTTAMAALALIDAGLDPTVVVGTRVPQLQNRNWRKGNSNLFLLEACEYRGSFLFLHPSIVLLSSVDWDHVDAYPTPEAYRDAYRAFLAKLPADGAVVTHMGDSACREIAEGSKRRVIDADHVEAVTSMTVPGKHMQENAKLVIGLAQVIGIPRDSAMQSLKNFQGTWRRMEIKGDTKSGVTVVDDYAHHPSEIKATIAAMKEKFPSRRLVSVFQPHMHDRTRTFYDEFLGAFEGSDVVVVTDIYEARKETTAGKVSTENFARDIGKKMSGKSVLYASTLNDAELLLRTEVLKHGDVLLIMGAGDVTNLASNMLS